MSGKILIQQSGNSVVTDLGRTRGPRFGLPVNGALDQYSARAANILAGNLDNEPLIEVTALDFRMKAESDILIAVTGAPLTLTVGGRPSSQWEPISVRAGETISIRAINRGLRAYLAVHGSFEVPTLLGSCAPDTVVGFGLQLREGTELVTRRSVVPVRQPYFDLPLFRLGIERPDMGPQLLVDVTDGPDVEDFGESGELLFTSEYAVSGRSNHIGLRLGGQLPERTSSGEVLSRGVPVGAVEVPSREELLVLHRGRGVTAGYPVLAVVTSMGLDVLAQARPGDKVRFRKTTVGEATAAHRRSRAQLETLRESVNTVFGLLGIGCRPQWQDLTVAACS
ncbi:MULTISPECIES: biotin-dependent carboxyltransferase family protein [Arthrobacter]|uniref:Biotin-dependent carboxyltransferase n=1 Tax=Arthrobacter terricola TaxID=2547396 RepID=A0A4R5K7F7_9MICC|nr:MULTISPECIES: biotin-dependent carboxyltransferase family protein [Arthrobacter]MBT8163619.1 biotin-dependent carboxyltransferase family protein [Arthrobacter sp. GN70]TDF88327.1 biotin-dependent carboxyltransferase [Arthrobacter terricola]